MLSEKMKLELDVTGLIDNTKSDADNIEAVFITDDNTIYKSSDSVDLITDIDN